MASVECSLLADGPSDAALTPILKWVLQQYLPGMVVQCEIADLRRLRSKPLNLSDRILAVVDLYPCEVLFIHRDAENQPPDWRYKEIEQAVTIVRERGIVRPHVCVVPVRMQEAWLLLDEAAIRRASGNPNGHMQLTLPSAAGIEDIPDPKEVLYTLLKTGSGLKGRRLKKFREGHCASLVTTYIRDFTCLRILPAFQRLEVDVHRIAAQLKPSN
jgi:hypothetical protein